MEIERKFLPEKLPFDLEAYPSSRIEQAYLCVRPVVRIRREDGRFWLTYKSSGLLAREEYNLALTEEAWLHLLAKADGRVLKKRRFRVPLGSSGYTAEIDRFEDCYEGLILVEVEFPTQEEALAFEPPAWFGREVTYSGEYQNSRLALLPRPAVSEDCPG